MLTAQFPVLVVTVSKMQLRKVLGKKLVAPIHLFSCSSSKKFLKKSVFQWKGCTFSACTPSSGTCHHCCFLAAPSRRGKTLGMRQWANLCASSPALSWLLLWVSVLGRLNPWAYSSDHDPRFRVRLWLRERHEKQTHSSALGRPAGWQH